MQIFQRFEPRRRRAAPTAARRPCHQALRRQAKRRELRARRPSTASDAGRHRLSRKLASVCPRVVAGSPAGGSRGLGGACTFVRRNPLSCARHVTPAPGALGLSFQFLRCWLQFSKRSYYDCVAPCALPAFKIPILWCSTSHLCVFFSTFVMDTSDVLRALRSSCARASGFL